jgi:hypothetical protein
VSRFDLATSQLNRDSTFMSQQQNNEKTSQDGLRRGFQPNDNPVLNANFRPHKEKSSSSSATFSSSSSSVWSAVCRTIIIWSSDSLYSSDSSGVYSPSLLSVCSSSAPCSTMSMCCIFGVRSVQFFGIVCTAIVLTTVMSMSPLLTGVYSLQLADPHSHDALAPPQAGWCHACFHH